ncbi:MAG TPA: TauD/TfdA family dioxygenase [Gemmataceae bacterium]|nr:TauD/TfdA family dioxygenase [Gemmataceae bacterium]
MRTPTTENLNAWRANSIDKPAAWHHPLSARALTALDSLVRTAHADQTVTAMQINKDVAAACADDVAPILAALETGRGFIILTAGQADRYSTRQWQIAYWLIGQLLGQPIEQNTQSTLLYDVRDTGQDVRYGARFSLTNSESSFHTDNSFGSEVCDYVGLLCLHGAKSGGHSQLVSGQTVQQELQTHHRSAWELLRQPFHIDRRGGIRPGEGPTAHVPILEGDGPALVIRYLRYWIEVGQEKVGQPLTAAQIDALNTLDRVASEPALRVEFTLNPGEMLFINNRWILHNRTGFEDFAEAERKRHLSRLWVRRLA